MKGCGDGMKRKSGGCRREVFERQKKELGKTLTKIKEVKLSQLSRTPPFVRDETSDTGSPLKRQLLEKFRTSPFLRCFRHIIIARSARSPPMGASRGGRGDALYGLHPATSTSLAASGCLQWPGQLRRLGIASRNDPARSSRS